MRMGAVQVSVVAAQVRVGAALLGVVLAQVSKVAALLGVVLALLLSPIAAYSEDAHWKANLLQSCIRLLERARSIRPLSQTEELMGLSSAASFGATPTLIGATPTLIGATHALIGATHAPVAIGDFSTMKANSLAVLYSPNPDGVQQLLKALLSYHHAGKLLLSPHNFAYRSATKSIAVNYELIPSREISNGVLVASYHEKLAKEFTEKIKGMDEIIFQIWVQGEKVAEEFNKIFPDKKIRMASLSFDWRGAENFWRLSRRESRLDIDIEHTDVTHLFATRGWSPTNKNLGTNFPSYGGYQAPNDVITMMAGDLGAVFLEIPSTLHVAPQYKDARLLTRWDFLPLVE